MLILNVEKSVSSQSVLVVCSTLSNAHFIWPFDHEKFAIRDSPGNSKRSISSEMRKMIKK